MSGQRKQDGGRGKIRTFVDISRQIYSLLPLTTRPPIRSMLQKQRPLNTGFKGRLSTQKIK